MSGPVPTAGTVNPALGSGRRIPERRRVRDEKHRRSLHLRVLRPPLLLRLLAAPPLLLCVQAPLPLLLRRSILVTCSASALLLLPNGCNTITPSEVSICGRYLVILLGTCVFCTSFPILPRISIPDSSFLALVDRADIKDVVNSTIHYKIIFS